MMEDFEAEVESSIKDGQRNLRAKKLLSNWCHHAEFVQSGGIGMIAIHTGLPIGHMGVQCKYSKANSMYSWLLEDSIYDFYKNNCKNCEKRIPVGFPNILDFITPREKAVEERIRIRNEEIEVRRQEQAERRKERALLRFELSHNETFVLDQIDILDQDEIKQNDPRLEELANLAPEIFTRKIIDHLFCSIFSDHLPYSVPVARALLKASLTKEEKFAVAIFLLKNNRKDKLVIDTILSNKELLSISDFPIVLRHFASMAVKPPPSLHFSSRKEKINRQPIQELFEIRKNNVEVEIDLLINDENPFKKEAAIKIILAIDCNELFLKYLRLIISNLMRRQLLLPSERKNSSVLYYFRETAIKSLEKIPHETDKVIQTYLADNNDVGKIEATKIYKAVLSTKYNKQSYIGDAQKIAFERLIWLAVNDSGDNMNEAIQFFHHYHNDFFQLAVDKFDDLIGAATILSQKYEKVDEECLIDVPNNFSNNIEKNN
ncbi:TPA: hypothetical protein MW256_003330, partial [Acinetobacter baumannii]|nr:hypothetical protein [Acinetobacter baumannii]